MATIGERNFVVYRGVALSQGLAICMHVGSESAKWPPHIMGDLYEVFVST